MKRVLALKSDEKIYTVESKRNDAEEKLSQKCTPSTKVGILDPYGIRDASASDGARSSCFCCIFNLSMNEPRVCAEGKNCGLSLMTPTAATNRLTSCTARCTARCAAGSAAAHTTGMAGWLLARRTTSAWPSLAALPSWACRRTAPHSKTRLARALPHSLAPVSSLPSHRSLP